LYSHFLSEISQIATAGYFFNELWQIQYSSRMLAAPLMPESGMPPLLAMLKWLTLRVMPIFN
jgi:hypothetical protein